MKCHEVTTQTMYARAAAKRGQISGRMRTCLLCREAANLLTALIMDGKFMGLWEWAHANHQYGFVCDWLEDQGHEDIAEQVRESIKLYLTPCES